MAALQKVLDDSIPSSELEKANKQYNDLTMKYRDLLQRDNHLVQRTTALEHLEVFRHFAFLFLFFQPWLALTRTFLI